MPRSVSRFNSLFQLSCCVVIVFLITAAPAYAQEPSQSTTVIGPSNLPLNDGAAALRAADPERALPLLKLGLKRAKGDREFVGALSNICAAYVMLEQYPDAIAYCTRALKMKPNFWRALNNRALAYLGRRDYPQAAEDIRRGLELAPEARNLRKTQLRYEQAVNPVVPVIIIDDRRVDDVPTDR